MNKYTIFVLALALVVGGFAAVKAENMATFRNFTLGTDNIERMTDPDNGNVCYMVMTTVTGASVSISCVPAPVVTKK